MALISAQKQRDKDASNEAESNMTYMMGSQEQGKDLKEDLKAKIRGVYNASEGNAPVESLILESEVYSEIKKMIPDNGCMTEALWEKLHAMIDSTSPLFFSRLEMLSGGMDDNETRIAMLLKCGIRPTDISTLICKGAGAITYHRKKLCKRLFGEEESLQYFDSILRIL